MGKVIKKSWITLGQKSTFPHTLISPLQLSPLNYFYPHSYETEQDTKSSIKSITFSTFQLFHTANNNNHL